MEERPYVKPFLISYIACSKGAMAADLWVVQGGLGAWDPKFLRPFNDWEMDAIQAFIGLTSNSFMTFMLKDKMIWKGDVSGCFTVKAYFNFLEGASPYLVPTKMLWNPYVSSKIGFFFPRRLGGVRFSLQLNLRKEVFI